MQDGQKKLNKNEERGLINLRKLLFDLKNQSAQHKYLHLKTKEALSKRERFLVRLGITYEYPVVRSVRGILQYPS